MTAFTKEIEDKIRTLGQALKLQMDFAAAADMTAQKDALQFAQNNAKTAMLMIELIQTLKLTATDDAGYLEAIVKVAETNNSNAGALLKAQVPKVRAVNGEVRDMLATQKTPTATDLNAIFRKHLKPNS